MTTKTEKDASMKRRAFVHRYKWSHADKRKKFRRMQKDGKARIVEQNNEGWLYEY